MTLLSVENLHVRFGALHPIDGVSFSIEQGEILGVVGESGSGKSITALTILGLLHLQGGEVDSGRILFNGIDLLRLVERERCSYRGKQIAFISQNPMTSLDPLFCVGDQIAQGLVIHLGKSWFEARARAIELMRDLRIPNPEVVYDQFPHQLSGGLKQRIAIAIALSAEPRLIVADEPTTALDVTVQAQVLHLLHRMTRTRGIGLILITHDMGVVAQICDRMIVMYAGTIVEAGKVEEVFTGPRHPYTRALINCIPRVETQPGALMAIPGIVPNVTDYPPGCRFHPRCPRALPCCSILPPRTVECGDEVSVACHLYDPSDWTLS